MLLVWLLAREETTASEPKSPFRAFRDMGRVRCGVKSGSLAKLREAVASGKIKRVHKGMLGAVSIPGNSTRL
jgi:hypothetical protein